MWKGTRGGGATPIKSIQRGMSTAFANKSVYETNITVNAVDPNYCFVKIQIADTGGAGATENFEVQGKMTASNNLYLRRGDYDAYLEEIHWEIIEFNPDAVKYFAKGDQYISDVTTIGISIQEVDPNKVLVNATNYNVSLGSDSADALNTAVYLANSTTLNVRSQSPATYYVHWQLVEFK